MYNNGLISDIHRQQVEGYLATKWNIPGYPGDHPFRTAVIPAIPPFSPRHLSNCAFWLDAADPTAFTSNTNSIVVSVKDKSSYGRNLSNTMTTNGFTWNQTKFNGTYPSFYYNSTQNVTLGSNSVSTFGSNTMTMFSVHERVTVSSNSYIFDVSGAVRFSYFYWTSAPPSLRVFSGINQGMYTTAASNGPVFQSMGLLNLQSTVYEFGTSLGTLNTGALDCSKGITVGSTFNTPTATFQGHIAEILIYNRAFSDAERQRVEGYLAWKWGLQAKLPATHPYKNIKLY